MLSSESIKPDRIADAPSGNKPPAGLGAAVDAFCWRRAGIVRSQQGLLVLQSPGEGILRMKLFPGEAFLQPIHMSGTAAVMGAPAASQAPSLSETGGEYRWSYGGWTAAVSKADSSTRFYGGQEKPWAELAAPQWEDGGAVSVVLRTSSGAHYYGLGEKTGFLDKRGERYEMWNSDIFSPHVPDMEALYQSIPFLLTTGPQGVYGLFLDHPGRSVFDMRSRPDQVYVRTETGSLDLYVIAGPEWKDVIRRYTALTGRTPLPPRWALGYHQSRYSYTSQEEVLELARTFRAKGIPCDAIHLDIHYMDGYRVFTFDPEKFPDPAGLVRTLLEMGIKTVPIVDPGVKADPRYPVFQEGLQGNYYCRKPDGEPFLGPVWPGDSAFPDFLSEEASEWWGRLHRYYTDLGIEGIWNDMNEPSVFTETKTLEPDTLHWYQGAWTPHKDVHNLYGLHMSKSTWEGLDKALKGRRPFVLTRAGYAGIQRYAAVWTGDNRSYWEHMAMAIPMVLNLGLSGVAFAGPDIGGFAHHTSGELLARWTQMGALFPYCRNHSEWNTIRQEPWCFGPEVEEICRTYIRLRYRWMPYLYSLFREAAETGLPVMRPLLLEYPDDPKTANLCDQFMLGSGVMAAPVIRPGADHRSVYLPEGIWYDYWSGARLTGGTAVLAHAPLDTLPLYVKAGTILPWTKDRDADGAADREPDELQLDVYCSGNAAGSFEVYEDDGVTYAHREGAYNLYRLEVNEEQDQVSLVMTPLHKGYRSPWKRWTVRFLHMPYSACRHVHGADQWEFQPEPGTLVVSFNEPPERIVAEMESASPRSKYRVQQ